MKCIPRLPIVCCLLVVISLTEGCNKDEYIPITTTFYNSYSGSGDLTGRAIVNNGNGFTVCGYGHNPIGDEDFILLQTDSLGTEINRRFVGTPGNDQCWSFVRANDGGYVISGWTDMNDPGVSNDILVIKTDQDGNQVWSKIYGGIYNDLSTHIIATTNGYVVSAIKGNAADENSWILRLDENGDTLWTFSYGGNSPDGAMSICTNNDGTFAVTGYTNSSGNGSTDGYLMVLSDSGTLINYWPFGTQDYEEPHCIEQVGNRWVISGHAGTTDFHTHDVFVQFFNSNGSSENFLTYGDHDHDGAEAMMIHAGTIYIAARSASVDPLQDPYFLMLNENGELLNQQWLGSSNEDPAFGIYADGNQQILTGYARDPITGRKNLLLLRR
jgi:hypothetical protein